MRVNVFIGIRQEISSNFAQMIFLRAPSGTNVFTPLPALIGQKLQGSHGKWHPPMTAQNIIAIFFVSISNVLLFLDDLFYVTPAPMPVGSKTALR